MNFYIINNSLNKKILGNYPQTKEIKYNCDVWDEPRFVEHTHFMKIDFEPITANAVLYNKSINTDLISVTGMGFTLKLLMSGKLKKILENSNNRYLQFFKSDVFHKENILNDYWLLNVYKIDNDYIDIEKSTVLLRQRKPEGGTVTSEVKFKSLNEFNSKLIQDKLEGYLYFDKIQINNDISCDFFVLRYVFGGAKYIVSEKLKQKIEDAGCTGIEFQPVELSYNEWTAPGGEREKIYGKL